MRPPALGVKETVEMSLALGHPLARVVHHVTGRNLAEIAREEGWRRCEVSQVLNAHPHRVYPKIRARLAERLGVPLDVLQQWIAREADRRRAQTEAVAT